METWTDFRLVLNENDILRGEGADPESVRHKRPILQAAQTALEQGMAWIRPVVVFHEAQVAAHRHDRILLEGGQKLTGPLVTRHLAGAEAVLAVICTIGKDLEIHAAQHEDTLLKLALDGLGNAAVEELARQACGRLAERAGRRGLQAGTPLSPGEPEWPVEIGQAQLFALADPTAAGVTLTSGGMMVPKKSVSFVIGLGKDMAQSQACDVCGLRETCRYRREKEEG